MHILNYTLIIFFISSNAFGGQRDKTSEILNAMDEISNRYYIIEISSPTREEYNRKRFFYKDENFIEKFQDDLYHDQKKLENAKKIATQIYLNGLDDEVIKSGCDLDNLSFQTSYYISSIEKIRNCISTKCKEIDTLVGVLSVAVDYNVGRFRECGLVSEN